MPLPESVCLSLYGDIILPIALTQSMAFLHPLHRALASLLLLVIITGWFVVPLASWVPKLVGCEHVVLLGLDHSNLHLAVIHADGSVDHRDHGADCPGHDVPKDTRDHSKHGVHMPQFERETLPGLPVPSPVVRLLPLELHGGDAFDLAISSADDAFVPAFYSPPSELKKTTVLLI